MNVNEQAALSGLIFLYLFHQPSTQKGVALVGAGIALASGHPDLLTASVTTDGGAIWRHCWHCGTGNAWALGNLSKRVQLMDAIIIGMATGAVSSIATVTALKIEISWIKKELERLHVRLYTLERKS